MIIEANQAAHDFNCPYGMCFTLYCKQWKRFTIAFGLNLNSIFFFSNNASYKLCSEKRFKIQILVLKKGRGQCL